MEPEYVMKEEYDVQLKRIEDEESRQNHRIQKIEDKVDHLNELDISINKIASSVETMSAELQNQGKRLENIEKIPGSRWNTVVTVALTAAVTAAVTYFLSH